MSANIEIPSGIYTISSVSQQGKGFVGRHPVEDRSLNPKRILSLPPNIKPLQTWELEALGNGEYYLKARGAPTTAIKDLIYAVLLDHPPPKKWFLRLNLHSRFSYNILDAENRSQGWILPEGDEEGIEQVKLGEVHGGINPNELWNIVRLEETEY